MTCRPMDSHETSRHVGGERITPNLVLALVLVSVGMVLVNKRPRAKGQKDDG